MSRPKTIELNWTYPKIFGSAWESEQSYGRGIYQISRLFGTNETLLYIGLVKGELRNFYERLNKHSGWLQNVRGTIYIRFGKVVLRRGFTLTEKIIETIDGVLIYQHQPFKNTSKMKSYSIDHHLQITNTGYHGHMNKFIDTREHVL